MHETLMADFGSLTSNGGSGGTGVPALVSSALWSLDPAILGYAERAGLLDVGHFSYRSGHHSALKLDRDRLLSNPQAASRMGYAIAKRFFIRHIGTVATPSIWGAGLAQWVGYFLDPQANVLSATPRDGQLGIADNLTDLLDGSRVLLVDNIIISGETLTAFAAAITGLGGEIIGVGTLWNAGPAEVAGHTVFGLLNEAFPAWSASDCPICREGKLAVVDAGY